MSGDISVRFAADLAKFQSELQQLPGMTEVEARKAATKMATEMYKGELAAGRAAAKTGGLTDSLGTNSKAWKENSAAIGQTKESVAQLSSALSVVSPEAGAAVSKVGALAGAGKAVATTFGQYGPIGIAAAAALAAVGLSLYTVYQNEKLAAQEATEFGGKVAGMSLATADSAERTRAAAEALAAMRANAADTQVEIAVLTGEMTRLEAETNKATLALWKQANPALVEQARRLGEAQDELAKQQRTLSNLRQAEQEEVDAGWRQYVVRAEEQVEDAEVQVSQERVKLADLGKEFQLTVGLRTESLALADANRQRGDASHVAALQGEEDMRRALAAVDAYKAALAETSAIEREAQSDTLTQSDRILAKRDEELAKLDKLAAAGVAAADVEQARAEVVERSERDLADVRQKMADDYEAAREKAHQDELARLDEQSRRAWSSAQFFFQGVTSLSKAAADAQAEGNAEAAGRWFNWYKAASILQVVVNQALAITKAYADLGPVWGSVAAVGLVGLMAAEIATIESQQLTTMHSGGRVPGEAGITALEDEHVVTRRGVAAAGGHEALDALDRGESPWPSTIEVGLRFGHRTTDRIRVDLERRGGVPGRGRQPVSGHRAGW